MEPTEELPVVRLVLLGSGGVGLSCLVMKWIQDTFSMEYDPTIENCYRKIVELDGQRITVEVIDTAGQLEYLSLTSAHAASGQGFIFGASLTQPASIADLGRVWFPLVDRERKTERYPYCVLVATQKDCLANDEDTYRLRSNTLQQIAQERGILYIETSSRTGENVNDAFMEAVRVVWNNRDRIPPVDDASVKAEAEKQRKKCLIQ